MSGDKGVVDALHRLGKTGDAAILPQGGHGLPPPGENFVAVALVFAILSAIFVEPLVIVVTAICGAVNASLAIVATTGLEGNLLIMIGIAVAISIVGMIIQFMMHSRKIGKREKRQAAIIKEQDSVESEVEKARLVLDDFEEDDETDE